MPRLIQPADLPETLWHHGTECMHLAPDLLSVWKRLLKEEGLEEKAQERGPDGEIGGLSKEETDDHLAWRFTGSAARVQLGLLDPRGELDKIADAFARIFSGGTVLLADLPSGSGPGVLTLLACIAELRRQGRVPREPLHVKIIGGELSLFARTYATQAMTYIQDSLADQAIEVSAEFLEWNALDRLSTAKLTNRLTLVGNECSARLMLLANFSGFLQGEGKWREAKQQFENLFFHWACKNSFVIWIEPQTNKVLGSGGFFSRALAWFAKLFSSYHSEETQQSFNVESLGTSNCEVQHPLKDHKFRVQLAIQRFDLDLEEQHGKTTAASYTNG